MDQISNFREVLGLDKQLSMPAQMQTTDEEFSQVKEKNKVKQNKKLPSCSSGSAWE